MFPSPVFRPITMAFRSFWRSKSSTILAALFQSPAYNQRTIPVHHLVSPLRSLVLRLVRSDDHCQQGVSVSIRHYHDGRPRGPLWRGKKMIGKEALFVILGLKRFKDDEENLEKFIRTNVRRLLKMDMVAFLNELERQQEFLLALTVIQKEDWYKPDVYLHKDLIIALAKCKRMDAMF